ncbi:T9SS type A sorting domain-containing protein, partial [Confluentibacter lentus]|uniref:T9SS type A sorting domain-containing protein n=1 Tax=Confluentibacter lentus TaxID=1699412 RepID=UPI001E4E924C
LFGDMSGDLAGNVLPLGSYQLSIAPSNQPGLILNFKMVTGSQSSNCFYEETNNILVIEAEDIDTDGLWDIKNNVTGFSGSGYLEWGNGEFFTTPGNGEFSAKIKINNTGVYKFQWRTKVGAGTSSTDENDSWLRFPDADDFFGQDGSSIIYPTGSGKTPNPEGAGSAGWFKVYSNGTTNWTWSTLVSDNDGHEVFVRFDSPGIYTMEISARSEFHLLDRIVLSKSIVSNPTNLAIDEATCSETIQINGASEVSIGIEQTYMEMNVSANDPEDVPTTMKLYPNPTNESATLEFEKQIEVQHFQVFDLVGRLISTVRAGSKSKRYQIQVSNLQEGTYLIRAINSNGQQFQKQMVIKR